NSTAAFQIQNAGGTNLVNVSTATTGTNLIPNPSFENGSTSNWSGKGSGTLTSVPSNTQANFGVASLQFTTGASSGGGIQYRFPFKPNTQYSLSVWLRRSTSTVSNINIGRRDNGSDTNCLTNQTVN